MLKSEVVAMLNKTYTTKEEAEQVATQLRAEGYLSVQVRKIGSRYALGLRVKR